MREIKASFLKPPRRLSLGDFRKMGGYLAQLAREKGCKLAPGKVLQGARDNPRRDLLAGTGCRVTAGPTRVKPLNRETFPNARVRDSFPEKGVRPGSDLEDSA